MQGCTKHPLTIFSTTQYKAKFTNCKLVFKYRSQFFQAFSDNGTEFKGTKDHEFVKACYDNNIIQKFTKVGRPQTNGKAERVIRALMQMWHNKCEFTSSDHRKQELTRFLNVYNTVKPHSSLTKKYETTGKTHTFTPYEWFEFYFKQSVNNG